MKCPNCGNDLEPGKIYCEHCGHEIQIVPDYDPLDELLIGQEEPESGKPVDVPKMKRAEGLKEKAEPQERVRSFFPLRFRYKCALLAAAILVCFGAFLFSYSTMTSGNNYSYQFRKGRKYAEKEEYEKAVMHLRRACELQEEKGGTDSEPLSLLAKAYAGIGAKELAVNYMEQALELETEQGNSKKLKERYLDMMDLLNETGQTELVSIVIEDCPYKDIQESLLPYRIEKPVCDTPEGIYNYYLRLNLSAEYGAVYYTLDGTLPTKDSTRYETPIELTEEGDVLLCAVAINKKGMISEPLVLAYKLDFPVADADADVEE